MCIVQAREVSTTTCIDYHILIVSFLSEMNYFATLAVYFSDGKNKPIKRTHEFISDQEVLLLLTMILFVRKAIQKKLFCFN